MSVCLKKWIFLADKYDEIISQKQVPSAQIVFFAKYVKPGM